MNQILFLTLDEFKIFNINEENLLCANGVNQVSRVIRVFECNNCLFDDIQNFYLTPECFDYGIWMIDRHRLMQNHTRISVEILERFRRDAAAHRTRQLQLHVIVFNVQLVITVDGRFHDVVWLRNVRQMYVLEFIQIHLVVRALTLLLNEAIKKL